MLKRAWGVRNKHAIETRSTHQPEFKAWDSPCTKVLEARGTNVCAPRASLSMKRRMHRHTWCARRAPAWFWVWVSQPAKKLPYERYIDLYESLIFPELRTLILASTNTTLHRLPWSLCCTFLDLFEGPKSFLDGAVGQNIGLALTHKIISQSLFGIASSLSTQE